MLDLDLIRIDGDTQSREKIDEAVVAEYAEAMKAGVQFPPVIVFFDGVDRWLADGFHRYHGARLAGLSKIYEEISPGTRRDAVLYSLKANATHGLKRTHADKRKAVETLLKDAEWSAWSDRKIAEVCGVGNQLVGEVRRAICVNHTDTPATRTVERNGKTYQQNTAKIGRTPAPAPADSGDTPAARPESEVSGTALDMPDSRGIDPAPAQRPKRAAPNPAPAVSDDVGQAQSAQVLALQEEVSALREQLQEAQADNASIAQILDASDQLAAAMVEAKRERDLARGLQSRINSLMTQVADLKRQVAHWKKKAGG
ncbi:MAG: hypothetical protein RJB68_2484 [Pseudomonadota bacterium]|jgi:hypothetical protein|uniref:hypothetical protein n=1 Tax=Acidovorax sp. K2F TaxID=2978125 RepID=UPI0021B0F629|nr:hypothetical protein [Acidovorax sp. K2F]MCT6721642.1 hypothetical protein [Acidovorax sp. K2F]